MEQAPDVNEADPYLPPAEPLAPDPLAGMSPLKRFALMVCGGILYGLVMRLLFGGIPGIPALFDGKGPMLLSFGVLVPIVLGMITVYGLVPERRSILRALFAPWLTVIGFAVGTAIMLLEGSICIAIMLPAFLVESSIGGALMLVLLRMGARPSRSTTASVLLLPLLLGGVEARVHDIDSHRHLHRSRVIHATPEQVWRVLNDVQDIHPEELGRGLAWNIGLPYPLSGRTEITAQGRVRRSRWQHGIRFDEPISEWRPSQRLSWVYRFQPGSIPVDALDDHVALGGRYAGLDDTRFTLIPVPGGTKVDLDIGYRVSTNFNMYSAWWMDRLLGDGAERILAMYARRTESASSI
ncbi:SRPBCC family protein [Solilutibacter silvestris]|uniref:Polyketide cyclase/dehydrase-related protein n=1 Tax=Solilutibacter silvestris TaxID=1645665 RepID=A0A2K1PYD6_9GAMM|nr:SRPBCC family protein [Lysobacter silvestris]PNS07800.1 Polyketide cyclase/dehydrase-related protein [Lysobacter silvestris]